MVTMVNVRWLNSVVVVTIVFSGLVNCNPDLIPGMPEQAQRQLINGTIVVREQAAKDFWGDLGKDLTNTWNTVKKVAVKVVKVVDKIFTPTPRSNTNTTIEWSTYNSSDKRSNFWVILEQKMQERRRIGKYNSKKKNVSKVPRTRCAGEHSFEKLSKSKTAKYCVCELGYHFDANGTTTDCVDIDECTMSKFEVCGPNATCINTDGWYKCECPEKFFGDPLKICLPSNATDLATSDSKIVTTVVSTPTENPLSNEVIAKPDDGAVISDS